jgi:hypothetical protein
MLRFCALILFAVVPVLAAVAEQMTWRELSSLTGRQIRMTMPNAATIEGRITAVEPDSLVLQVRKTSDRATYPQGRLSIPRAQVTTIGLHWKTKRWRVVGTICGAWLGLGFGAYAALHTESAGPALATLAGVGAGLTTLGYVAGSAADSRSTTVVIRE